MNQRLSFATTLFAWFDSWRMLAYMVLPVVVVATGAIPIRAPGYIFGPLFIATLGSQFVALRLLARGYYPPLLSILFEVLRMPAVLPATLSLLRPPRAAPFRVTRKTAEASPHRTPVPPLLWALAALSAGGLVWFGATLAGRTDLALGVSDYNRQELLELGFERTGVLPIVVDTARLTTAGPVPALESLLQDGLANILFVGRIAPNKKIEDHIRLAEVYKRFVDERYRFIFVGKTDGVPRYYNMVRALIAEFQMPPDRFIFTGPVPDEELAVYYRTASVYVSLSEHEGFCVPLLEAMAADVPVLAFASSAVPDTLGGAGVMFEPKDLEFAAELLGELAFNGPLRSRVIAAQRQRLSDFGDARIMRELNRVLAQAGAMHVPETAS